MAAFCITHSRTTTCKNITRICNEFNLDLSTITGKQVREAYTAPTVLPDDMWKLEALGLMLEERQDLREAGKEGEEREELLTFYISLLCEM